jgi:hypothetical protein
MHATKGVRVGAWWTRQQAGKKKRGAVRGRKSRQPNVSPVRIPNVSSEYRVRHAASKGCGSAGRQQRVQELGLGGQVLDLRDGELQVVAECLRPCVRRGCSLGVARRRGVAAVVGRKNKGQLQEQRVM